MIKEMILKEKEFLKNYVDNAVLKIEKTIAKYNKEFKDGNDAIKAEVKEFKNNMNTELTNLNTKIDGENKERKSHIKDLVSKINQKFEEVNKLIDGEKKEREELENSCVKNRETSE